MPESDTMFFSFIRAQRTRTRSFSRHNSNETCINRKKGDIRHATSIHRICHGRLYWKEKYDLCFEPSIIAKIIDKHIRLVTCVSTDIHTIVLIRF
jgi:hypothetical protein